MLETYLGGCHCGAIRFEVKGDLADLCDCNCSVCTKKGFLHLIVAQDHFTLLAGHAALATYQFNTRIAKHHFCRTCGMHPFYIPRSDPDKIDVNARCIDDIDISILKPVRFDGRHWETAMQTRSLPSPKS
jgi:hypothetical protein